MTQPLTARLIKNRFQSRMAACIIAASWMLMNCSPQGHDHASMKHFPEFCKIGHRGSRGFMPENTIPSMKKAIEDGANIIERGTPAELVQRIIGEHVIELRFDGVPEPEPGRRPDPLSRWCPVQDRAALLCTSRRSGIEGAHTHIVLRELSV